MSRRAVWAAGAAAALALRAPAGSLEWESTRVERVHDFRAATQSAVFRFRNAGDAPVAIVAVRTACVCAVSALARTVYAPGEQGELIVTADVFGDQPGRQEARVYVQTGEPRDEVTCLELSVVVPEIARVRPPMVVWAGSAAPEERRIAVEAAGEAPIAVSRARSRSPALDVRLRTREAGRRYDVLVRPVAPVAAPSTKTVQIDVELADGPTVTFTALAAFRADDEAGAGGVLIQPRSVVWERGDSGARTVSVAATVPDPVRIVGTNVLGHERFNVRVRTIASGERYELLATPVPGAGPGRGLVTLTTDYPPGQPQSHKILLESR